MNFSVTVWPAYADVSVAFVPLLAVSMCSQKLNAYDEQRDGIVTFCASVSVCV